MFATYCLLALLWLPGVAAFRRWAPRQLERGALSACSLGYAASLALLAPWSLACYLLRLPAWVLAVCMASGIAIGAFDLIRARAWRSFRPPSALAAVGAALLATQLVLAGRVGGWLDGDATYHLGRIRDLVDHGFSNRDFYLAEPSGNPAYGFNLLHALHAAVVELTRQDMLLVWFASLPLAQLLVAASHYHLAQVVFGSRLAGWLAAVAVAVLRAPETYAVYPNLLAVGWLAPLLLAHVFDAQRADADVRCSAGLIAILAFVIGQVHALYWGFVVLAAAPLLVIRVALASVRRDRARARGLALCAAALLCGSPFALAVRHSAAPTPQHVRSAELAAAIPYELDRSRKTGLRSHADQSADTPALAAGGGHLEKQLDRRGEQWVMPAQRAGGAPFLVLGIVAIAVSAARLTRRRAVLLALAAAALTLLVIPLQPTLCTLVSGRVLPPFAVARMVTLAATLLVVSLAGAVALLLDRIRPGPALQVAAVLLVALAAMPALGHAPRTYPDHVLQAIAAVAERHALLRQHHAWRALLRAHVPAGDVVLASLRDGRYAAMLHGVRVVAVDRGHGAFPDIARRRDHVELMTAGKTPASLRERLLDHYAVRFVVYRDKYARRFRWARADGEVLGRSAGLELIRLDRGLAQP